MCATYHRFFAFPSSCLVFPRGIRNFLVISYLDNSTKLVIFKLHGLPPFCFPPSWFFYWPLQESYHRVPNTKNMERKKLLLWRLKLDYNWTWNLTIHLTKVQLITWLPTQFYRPFVHFLKWKHQEHFCLATQTKNGQYKTSTADCRLRTEV